MDLVVHIAKSQFRKILRNYESKNIAITCSHYLSESLLESLLESSSGYEYESSEYESESSSESSSESEYKSALINLGICILFVLYLHSFK